MDKSMIPEGQWVLMIGYGWSLWTACLLEEGSEAERLDRLRRDCSAIRISEKTVQRISWVKVVTPGDRLVRLQKKLLPIGQLTAEDALRLFDEAAKRARPVKPKKNRKQLMDLSADDLEATPVWSFALEEEGEPGQDESTVKPERNKHDVDPERRLYIVRSRFRFSDGTEHVGYLTPPEGRRCSGDVEAFQPAIVHGHEHFGFWTGIFPAEEQQEAFLRSIGKSKDEVFPISFVSEVKVSGNPVGGTIHSFQGMDSRGSGA